MKVYSLTAYANVLRAARADTVVAQNLTPERLSSARSACFRRRAAIGILRPTGMIDSLNPTAAAPSPVLATALKNAGRARGMLIMRYSPPDVGVPRR